MANKIVISIIACYLLCSCTSKTNISSEIPPEIPLTESGLSINLEDLGRIEAIQCNESLLITWDYHSGQSFSLFNNQTGKCYGRFGNIGEGPTEIPLPCGGYIIQNQYKIFSCATGYIAQYALKSLCTTIDTDPEVLSRKTFSDDFYLSAAVPVTDSLYLGAGVYNSQYQYVLFNQKGDIIDANTLIYNAHNDLFNKSQKILSNQGRLTKAPDTDKYAFFLNNSSNIDFTEVTNNKIQIIKLLRERNPQYTGVQEGTANIVYPDRKSSIGYIDIASGKNFVYALYTDKSIENSYRSNIVKVFDWQGNWVKTYKLAREAFYITANEANNRLYAAVKEADGGWNIVAYEIPATYI